MKNKLLASELKKIGYFERLVLVDFLVFNNFLIFFEFS